MTNVDSGKQHNNQPTTGEAKTGSGGGSNGDSDGSGVAVVDNRDQG
jgi:hypothetical protein